MTGNNDHIYSICPRCLRKLPAVLERIEGKEGIWMTRTCPEHGRFSVLVWKDYFDFEEWTEGEAKLSASEEDHCSGNCRKCSYHLQDC